MGERRGPSVAELERALTGLGGRIDLPEGEGIARAVAERLEREASVRPSVFTSRRRRRLVLAVAIGLLLLAAGAVATGIVVGRIRLEPAPSPSAPTSAPDTPSQPPEDDVTEFREGLGPRVTLDEAEDAVDFRVLVPEALGQPDRVHLNRGVPGGMVSLVYLPGPGLPEMDRSGAAVIATQFGGFVEGVKEFDSEDPPIPVDVDGMQGFFVRGIHTFVFLDDDGNPRIASGRRVASTLIWQSGGAVLRVESDLPLARVVEIAESMA